MTPIKPNMKNIMKAYTAKVNKVGGRAQAVKPEPAKKISKSKKGSK